MYSDCQFLEFRKIQLLFSLNCCSPKRRFEVCTIAGLNEGVSTVSGHFFSQSKLILIVKKFEKFD